MKLYREMKEALQEAYGRGEAESLARWVLEDRFHLSLTDLMLDKDNELSAKEQQELRNITVRLLEKEPVQYILGETTFCGLPIGVERGVLIPRPETAELVEWIRRDYEDQPAPRALDIGTGSGCIALALAHAGFRMEAWDVSPEALQVARRNAERLGLEVRFKQEDVLQFDRTESGANATESAPKNAPKDATESTEKSGTEGDTTTRFDLIVSNPPYICLQEARDMEDNVLRHEPHLALFVPDDDPLRFYRAIARLAQRQLQPGGRLYFEINRAYGRETSEMLTSLGFAHVMLRQDLYGNDRMVCATWGEAE